MNKITSRFLTFFNENVYRNMHKCNELSFKNTIKGIVQLCRSRNLSMLLSHAACFPFPRKKFVFYSLLYEITLIIFQILTLLNVFLNNDSKNDAIQIYQFIKFILNMELFRIENRNRKVILKYNFIELTMN